MYLEMGNQTYPRRLCKANFAYIALVLAHNTGAPIPADNRDSCVMPSRSFQE
jgi:hypothetical protein